MDEIKVKKENVLKAYEYYKSCQTINQPSDMVLLLKHLFPEAFEEEKKKSGLRELIGQVIGEASMCWNPRPKGVFDSSHASKIVDKLEEQIIDLAKSEADKCKSFDSSYDIGREEIKQRFDEM